MIRIIELGLTFGLVYFIFVQVLLPAIKGQVIFPALRPSAVAAEEAIMEARARKNEAEMEFRAAQTEAEAVKVENKTREILDNIDNGE